MDKKLRILILDDVQADAELVEHALRKASITCTAHTVSTKSAFLKQLKEFSPDIILSDYVMPEFDGMAALRLAQEHVPQVPFIVVTGSINEEAAVDCIKAGATDYVVKQHLARLGPAVKAALETKLVKVLEQQLVRSQKMESIGTMATSIAHEVGNPLTSILSLVQVIERTTSDETAKEKLDIIKSQISRISRIIHELVDFSRPTTHVVQASDLNQIVRDALNIVQYGKKVKDIVFDVGLNEHVRALEVVPDQLQQVFINILMNAVDSLEEKPGKISIRSESRGNSVVVTVTDSGKGIPEEDLEKIFEPFFTTKQTGRGTGLGLWVSYGIVKKFQGDIEVESETGRGTTFTVKLPVKGV